MYFNGTKCCLLILSSLLSASLLAKDATPVKPGQGIMKPLCFVENKGQVTGQDNNIRNDIQYKVSAPGVNLYVGNGELHYQFKEVEGLNSATQEITSYAMDVVLVGANPSAKPVSTDKNSYYENYYTAQAGPDGFTAKSYNKIVYKDVYPNIDWVLYVKDNKVEYDFVVNPGGNVNDIKVCNTRGATGVQALPKRETWLPKPRWAKLRSKSFLHLKALLIKPSRCALS